MSKKLMSTVTPKESFLIRPLEVVFKTLIYGNNYQIAQGCENCAENYWNSSGVK